MGSNLLFLSIQIMFFYYLMLSGNSLQNLVELSPATWFKSHRVLKLPATT